MKHKDVREMYNRNGCVLSPEILDELFIYDKNSGILIRKIGVPGFCRGRVVGCISKAFKSKHYINLDTSVFCKPYKVHRLIWFMVTSKWPNEIDHINGDATDNRWNNLRDVTRLQNCYNTQMRIDNTTGIVGVTRIKKCPSRPYEGWIARIWHNRKKVQLYFGVDFFEACCRRKSAEIKYGYSPNHGRRTLCAK